MRGAIRIASSETGEESYHNIELPGLQQIQAGAMAEAVERFDRMVNTLAQRIVDGI